MGLRNVPHYFNRAISQIFKSMIDEGFLKTYFDDLNAFSKDDDSHLEHLRKIFLKCRENNVKLNPEKTLIAFKEGPCLGFRLSGETIRPGIEKTQAIIEMPAPTNISEVKTFMGMVNFYRRFLPNLSRISAPINNLTKKDTPFIWDKSCQDSFSEIKKLIASDIALHHFDPSAPATVTSDASEQGWASSLAQDSKIIAFASGTFSPAQSKYAPHERECLGAIQGLEKFRHYLLGGPVILQTDSRAISWLQKSRQLSPRLFRWGLRLQEFSLDILHKEGTSIPFEDCGSRLPGPAIENCDLPSPNETPPNVSISLSSTINYYSHFPISSAVQTRSKTKNLPKLSKSTESPETSNGTDGKIETEQKQELSKEQWLFKAHSHPLAGHFGEKSTLRRLQSFTSWAGMAADVSQFVRNCKCQFTKSYPRIKPSSGFSQSFQFCDRVGIDFLGPYPPTPRNNRYIFFLHEFYSNSIFAFPCARADLATAVFFLKLWISQNDVPKYLISDNHVMFDGPAAQKTWSDIGIQKIVTPPHHQSSNGTTERSVGILKDRLRSNASSHLTDWDLKVSEAVTAANHFERADTGHSSFQLRFGRTPRGSFHPLEPTTPPRDDEKLILKRCLKQEEISKLTPRFKQGDLVKVKVDNRKHFTAPLWKGPFKITSESSHHLTLISPNFEIVNTHVDKVAPFKHPIGYIFGVSERNASPASETKKSSTTNNHSRSYDVESIIGHRWQDGKIQYLTKWVGWPVDQSTYEPPENFEKISLINAYNKKNGIQIGYG